jgi:O-antigen biosynthesis protein WbqP
MFYRTIKRILDTIFSVILIILFIPFWIIIPLIIKADSNGNILFKQKRVGLDSGYFTIFKFRTMKEGTPDIPTDELENQRNLYTGAGKVLRRLSIDEFPQLINILKGDMSFVGPRPALYNQDLLIKLRKEKEVDKVKPGVTGLAQINGRDNLSIPDKVMYDWQYVKNASLWLDLKIFMATIKAAITGRGINL